MSEDEVIIFDFGSLSKLKYNTKKIDIIEILSKEITEEDILVFKEKHFCLVHRGSIEGFSYICPKCGVYYCQRCANALIKLENACWSCKMPIDPTKPIVSQKNNERISIIENE